jgi:hypothetical protein
VRRYIATDQEYVRRLLLENLETNSTPAIRLQRRRDQDSNHNEPTSHKRGRPGSSSKSQAPARAKKRSCGDITFTPLDWERDAPETLKDVATATAVGAEDPGFDMLISCDCIYNDALMPAFVRTCADICRLRPAYDPAAVTEVSPSSSPLFPFRGQSRPTICVIAQQQRSPDVFETWLRAALDVFHVWRLNDDVLGEGLKAGTGYVVHALGLREKIG